MANSVQRRTYVLDTSVLLADPAAFARFDEHHVVIPVVVITELEAKRHHPELGFFARQALRYLDDLRITHGRLDDEIPVGELGGTCRVELNHIDAQVLPAGFRLGDNDTRILSVARSLANEGRDVVLVSKDMPLRIKASSIGLEAQEYRAELPVDSGWTGMAELDVTSAEVEELYDRGTLDCAAARALPCHTGLVLHTGSASALARVLPDKHIQLVRGDREAFGLHGRSAEQRIALDLLLDPEIGIVSMGGRAGTGKSALALCAGLEAVMERRQHRKVIVFRPLYPVGGQDLGYLPGSEAEKMGPWAQAVYDTLSAVTTQDVIDELVSRDMFEVLPLTHIRGRSLHDAFVIVDEAQSLERGVLLTVLSRIGTGSRVVLTHDIAQRDNLRVGRHDGVIAVIEKLKGHPLFAHVTLTRSERSAIAALVTDLLEDLQLLSGGTTPRTPRCPAAAGRWQRTPSYRPVAAGRKPEDLLRVGPKLFRVTGVMHNDQNRQSEQTATLPAVSVVMPVLNEEKHLAESVAAVLGQEYPGGFELVLAIGPSRDRTEAIARELAAADRRITVVANPSGQIATAMNAAVRTARHGIITRIDAHSMLPDGYLRTAVRTLMDTGAADVGGWMAAEGITPFQRAVAWAMTSPFGMGAAANHTGGDAGPADTVYLGVYRRSEIERVGGYDETMLIAEDWELNYRIRAAGGLIWFTPDLKVTYRPRDTLRALATQQFRYGRWRRVVARRHPETVNPRYLAAPAATALNAAGLVLGAAGLIGAVTGAPAPVPYLLLGFAIPAAYLGGVTGVAVAFARDTPAGVRARVPVALAAMHTCWGAGYLTSPRRLVGRHRG